MKTEVYINNNPLSSMNAQAIPPESLLPLVSTGWLKKGKQAPLLTTSIHVPSWCKTLLQPFRHSLQSFTFLPDGCIPA